METTQVTKLGSTFSNTDICQFLSSEVRFRMITEGFSVEDAKRVEIRLSEDGRTMISFLSKRFDVANWLNNSAEYKIEFANGEFWCQLPHAGSDIYGNLFSAPGIQWVKDQVAAL